MTKYNETSPIKIMLIDDSDTFRDITAKLLERYPIIKIICAASSGEEAVNCGPDCIPDVILLDLDMPGKTGFELLPELKLLFPKTKIIILTLMDGESFRRITQESGADGFVTKHKLVTVLIPTLYKLVGYSADKEKF